LRDTTRSQAFTYDQVNRITTAQTPAPCGSNCWSQSFTYDQWANLQAVAATGTAPPLANLAVNASNRITLGGWRTLRRRKGYLFRVPRPSFSEGCGF